MRLKSILLMFALVISTATYADEVSPYCPKGAFPAYCTHLTITKGKGPNGNYTVELSNQIKTNGAEYSYIARGTDPTLELALAQASAALSLMMASANRSQEYIDIKNQNYIIKTYLQH